MNNELDYKAAYFAEKATREYAERELQAEGERVRVLATALHEIGELLLERKQITEGDLGEIQGIADKALVETGQD